MADVSGTAVTGQSTERDAEHRVGRGLLSRFIGAVFLVLLGGLLVLDQALTAANREQAVQDTQSTGLLAESFIRAHDVLLQRLADLVVERSGTQDSLRVRETAARWLATMPSVRRRRQTGAHRNGSTASTARESRLPSGSRFITTSVRTGRIVV